MSELATIINDAPLSFDATETGSAVWEPKNFDGEFEIGRASCRERVSSPV